MDGLIGIGGVVALLLVAGAVIGVASGRGQVLPQWLIAAAGLVALNDAMLTRVYGLVPSLVPAGATWNWQGKAMALAATLAVAAAPALGWRPAGLTLRQERGSLAAALPLALVYCLFFLLVARLFPGDAPSRETVAFQLTMPGLEEEAFYRGVLLLALDRAFTARVRLLGVDWGWGAVLSCALFGLAHAFGYTQGHFTFDPIVMALTALPSFIAVWLRLRTGSVALPILLHNFGNSISLFA